MRNTTIIVFIFVLAAGLAGCQLFKALPTASLAEQCADAFPCKDTTIHDVVTVTDTIVEPYLDTILIKETVIDTVLGIPTTKVDTFYEAKIRYKYVTRSDTVTKCLRVDTAKQAIIDSLNARIKAVVDGYKDIKVRGKGAIWSLLAAVFGLFIWLLRRKTTRND